MNINQSDFSQAVADLDTVARRNQTVALEETSRLLQGGRVVGVGEGGGLVRAGSQTLSAVGRI